MTHECDSEFLTSAKLYDFQSDVTDFLDMAPGSSGSTSTAAAAKAKKPKATKLVDVTQLRNKFIVKITTVIKFTKTSLMEALSQLNTYKAEEHVLMEKWTRFSDLIHYEVYSSGLVSLVYLLLHSASHTKTVGVLVCQVVSFCAVCCEV